MKDRYQVRTPGVVHEVFEDEVVIVDLDSGDYFSLTDVGATCWNCLLAGGTFGETIEVVQSNFDGTREDIEAGLRTLLQELENANLIVAADGSGSSVTQESSFTGNGKKRQFTAPTLKQYSDMRDLLLIDPIHEVDESGWPQAKKKPEDPS